MKRVFAFLTLVLGLAAIAAPVQARVCVGSSHSALAVDARQADTLCAIAQRSRLASPDPRKVARDREPGPAAGPRSIELFVPTVLLADRTRE